MLKLKRTFSSYAQDDSQSMDSCLDNEPSTPQDSSSTASSSNSPMQHNNFDQTEDSRPSKRQRQFQKQLLQQQPQQSLLQQVQQGNLPTLVNSAKQHNLQKERPSQFASSDSLGLGPAELIATYKRQKYRKPKDQKVLLSEDDVREILQYQEQMLRHQYDNILRERLQEQFANFSQFSQDCIYRQFSNKDFSYTS